MMIRTLIPAGFVAAGGCVCPTQAPVAGLSVAMPQAVRIIGVAFLLAWLRAVAAAPVSERPNILLMLADDQGWDGLSVEMAPGVRGSRSEIFHTPHLEVFAAQGMRFSCAYAPAPVCSPTRISLQTGRSPAALHWTKAAPAERGRKLLEPTLVKEISADETTIGEMLREAGYATAHYGKWHIAGGGPGRHGYDEHDGDTGNEHAIQFDDPNPVDIFGMAERAEELMARSQTAGKPFFIQLSWNAVHAAENARKATLVKYAHVADGKLAAVAAITEDLDAGVGRILAAIDRLGLAGTTFVIFTSDNGSGGGGGKGRGGKGDGRAGLSGGKGSVWEGGIRVPFLVRGPGIAANAWCHVPIVLTDLFPTFCEWAGVPRAALPASLEGGSIARLVAGDPQGRVDRPREELVFHFPHYQSGNTPHSAIRMGALKLIRFYEDDRVFLFDLDADLGERENLVGRRPADAARLRARLDQSLDAIDAQRPTPNPDFDPSRPAAATDRGRNGVQGGNRKREGAE